MTLKGKIALVTGAASGIGAACAARYAQEGATVIATDIVKKDGIRQLDVGDSAAWAQLATEFPEIDILHLNAGGFRPGYSDLNEPAAVPLTDITDDGWRSIFRVNVDGVFYGARAFLPSMMKRKSGDILITASLAGWMPAPGDIAYPATKHAVIGLMRTVAIMLGGSGVCISAICPGTVDTPMVDPKVQELVTGMGMAISKGEDIANAAMRALQERQNGTSWTVWGNQIKTHDGPNITDLFDLG
jgi:meso-butanediol dehydrogenase / (S,S)-butanediol dehydrogenase / diacetyl reductase